MQGINARKVSLPYADPGFFFFFFFFGGGGGGGGGVWREGCLKTTLTNFF